MPVTFNYRQLILSFDTRQLIDSHTCRPIVRIKNCVLIVTLFSSLSVMILMENQFSTWQYQHVMQIFEVERTVILAHWHKRSSLDKFVHKKREKNLGLSVLRYLEITRVQKINLTLARISLSSSSSSRVLSQQRTRRDPLSQFVFSVFSRESQNLIFGPVLLCWLKPIIYMLRKQEESVWTFDRFVFDGW